MLNSGLETAHWNKRIYCFINRNFYEPHRKRECYKKKFARERFDAKEYMIFYLTLMRRRMQFSNL